MAARRRKKAAEVLIVSSSSSSESDDDAPPAPGRSRHRRTSNNQVNAKNQRPDRRTEPPRRSRKSLDRPRAPRARSPSPDLLASSPPPRRQTNPARKRWKNWNESSSEEEDQDRQRPNRRRPEKRRRQLQVSPPPPPPPPRPRPQARAQARPRKADWLDVPASDDDLFVRDNNELLHQSPAPFRYSPPPLGSPDFLPVHGRRQRDGSDFFDPTSPNPWPRRRGPAYRRAPSTPVKDRLPPTQIFLDDLPPRYTPSPAPPTPARDVLPPSAFLLTDDDDRVESPPPRTRVRRGPAPTEARRTREKVPELVLDESEDSGDGDGAANVVVVDDDEEDNDDAATDPMNEALAQVLLLFPDVLPSHVENLLAVHSDDLGGNYAAAIETVVALLVDDPAYPRVGDDEAEANAQAKGEEEMDWLDVPARLRSGEKPDPKYKSHALDLLMDSFRDLSTKLIKTEFAQRSHFFAPTFYALTTSDRNGDLATKKLKRPRAAPKQRVGFVAITEVDEQTGEEVTRYEAREEEVPELLAQEKRWVEDKIVREDEERLRQQRADEKAERERKRAEKLDKKARRRGIAIECQCCFDDIAVENTTACADGHLFCKTCAAANANTRLGQLQATLPCMAADCTALFLPITYSSFLPAVTVDALADLAQQKDLEMAFDGVEGFEKCPYCPYACFIESKMEKLFRCQRPECRKVSCRQCKLENHIPKTCDEVAKERSLASVHGVEEAMTAALIKNCPRCKVPTCKQDGCNKMTCSNCRIYWCHRCGEQITGYEHFADKNYGGKNPNGCPVFDDTAARERAAVEAARLQAQADLDGHAREAAEKLAENAAAPNRGQQVAQQQAHVQDAMQRMYAAQQQAQAQAQEAANWYAAMANAQNAINNVWANFAGVWRGW